MTTKNALDPITLSVVSGTLDTTIRDMTTIVRTTARSVTIAIGHDFSTTLFGVLDGVPTVVSQGEDQPVHLGVLIHKIKVGANYFGADVAPGDVMFQNDPATGGNHFPDVTMYKPIFFEGELFAWAAVTVHVPETGGPVAGGYNPDAQTFFGEGLRVPHVKLSDAGKMRNDVWDLILSNLRTPLAQRGDMGAMLSALNRAERRMLELCQKYGLSTVRGCMKRLVERAEEVARTQIRAMPHGLYKGRAVMEGDGKGSDDITVECRLEIKGDEMFIDLSAPPQTDSFLNSYRSNTLSAAYFAFLSSLDPGVPVNEGLYRPLHVDIGPGGTIINAVAPAACYASTGVTYGVVFDAVADALSKAAPEKACAGWMYQNTTTLSGIDPRDGEPFAYLSHLMSKGGGGAFYGRDGGDMWGVVSAGGASMTGDIELVEFRLPIHVHQHELLPDSGSPARWRGGLGAVIDIELQYNDALVTLTGGGVRFSPPDRLGGGSPLDDQLRLNRKWVRRTSGQMEQFPLHSMKKLEWGDRVIGHLSGGGGVGPAWQRGPGRCGKRRP